MTFKYEIEKIFVQNITNLLLNYDEVTTIGLAVSGGSDSIALLKLAHEWCRNYKEEVILYVFSVNHNLRLESLSECIYVRNFANELGYQCFILDWIHSHNLKFGIQEQARKMRYELLTHECKKLGIKNLLTGHQFDDMLETFYMRKQRKSGSLGLSSSYIYFVNDVRIVRPLYNITKADIQNYLLQNNVDWKEDPSNNLLYYERNKVRKEIEALSVEEINDLTHEMLNANQNCKLMNQKFIVAISECLFFSDLGFAVIDTDLLHTFDSELKIYIMNHVLSMVNGSTQYPRYRSVRKIISQLYEEQFIKITCHFCIIEKIERKFIVYREYDKILPNILLLQNTEMMWDNRFSIKSDLPYKDIYVTAMNNNEFNEHIHNLYYMQNFISLLGSFNKKLVRNIIMTVPVIKLDKKIIAIPSLSYYNGQQFRVGLNVLFKPQMVSRFTHFI